MKMKVNTFMEWLLLNKEKSVFSWTLNLRA